MTARRALFWLGSATLGALGGFLLGQMTIGEGLYGKLTGAGGAASYAEYSSNPSAATVDRLSPSLPCRNCPDSYAAAAHARAARLEAKRDDYQAIEPVEIVYPPLSPLQADASGEAGAWETQVDGDPPIAPGNGAVPARPGRVLAIRRVDDSRLVTIAPPMPRAVPVALPPAR